jgi:hypothetical protein
MSKKKEKETRDVTEEGGTIDREVLDVIVEQKRKVSGRAPEMRKPNERERN